ncbi:MAG: preprotein translocase subunit Sec61beta [Nanoarchaeota archaeon]
MADDKIFLPQSGGGLLRYSDEAPTKLALSPWTVMIVIGVIIVIGIAFHLA